MLTEPDLFGSVYWGNSLRYLQGGDGGREGAAELDMGPHGTLADPSDALRSFPKLKRVGRTGTISDGCGVPGEQTQPFDVIPGQGCSCEIQWPWLLWHPRFTARETIISPHPGNNLSRFLMGLIS